MKQTVRKHNTKDGLEYEESSGNVFADLGLLYSDELLLKADLGIAIFQIIEARNLTQTQAAKILNVKQPELSRLKAGSFSYYSIGRLLTFLKRLGRNIEVHIRNSAEEEGTMTVINLAEEPKKKSTAKKKSEDKTSTRRSLKPQPLHKDEARLHL